MNGSIFFWCGWQNNKQQRVRRSPYALNPEYDDEVEMQCTLRSWNENVRDAAAMSGSGKWVTSQWLAQQEEQQHNNGDQIDGTLQHQTGPEIIFRPVHSHCTVVVRHDCNGSVEAGGNGELSNQRFSHIRTRSRSAGRSPVDLVGRPPVASIERKTLIPAGDGTGSTPGTRRPNYADIGIVQDADIIKQRQGSRGRARPTAAMRQSPAK